SDDAGTETETTEETADGKSVFSNNCSVCHGFDGTGGNGGPSIAQVSDKDLVVKTVTDGRGGMPAFGDRLSDEEIEAVADHVVSLEP
ncbi:MAG: cytochrome c, partial [Rhodococcus sp.]|nr:cytochrome c [Rhodococcus sp. (in: high G+C Gram-positive bacteria)]